MSYEQGIKDILREEDMPADGDKPKKQRIAGRVFVGPIPDDCKDGAVGIIQTGGLRPEIKLLVDYPSIQVLVRSSADHYKEGSEKASKIKSILLGICSRTINDDYWNTIRMIGDIGYVGCDEKHRHLFSLNFSLIVEPAVTKYNTNRRPL